MQLLTCSLEAKSFCCCPSSSGMKHADVWVDSGSRKRQTRFLDKFRLFVGVELVGTTLVVSAIHQH